MKNYGKLANKLGITGVVTFFVTNMAWTILINSRIEENMTDMEKRNAVAAFIYGNIATIAISFILCFVGLIFANRAFKQGSMEAQKARIINFIGIVWIGIILARTLLIVF